MYINPKVVRSSYIGAFFRELFNEKKINLSELAERIGTSQPNLSNALNGRKVFSDVFFGRIGEALGLTKSELNKLFKDADIEEFMFKYQGDLPTQKEMTIKEGLEWLQVKAGLTNEQISAIKAIMAVNRGK